MNKTLKDKVYIVTGGSKGFGLVIAKALVEHGAKVGLVSRGQETLKEAVADIGSEHAFGVSADVSKRDQVVAALDSIHSHFSRIDGLINNAGMARPNKVENLIEAEVLLQVQTNLLGTIFCCQAAIPLLRGGENPRIINISSATAHHYDELCHLSIYAASKAAVERFSRDLRVELQPDFIGVSCLRPGAAWTSFADDWDHDATTEALKAWAMIGTHSDSGMETQNVADAVLFTLTQPPGVAVDLMEIRPNILSPK